MNYKLIKKGLVTLFMLVIACQLQAQYKSMYQKYWFIQTGDTLPYRLLLPENYDPQKTYPVVFFLHGRGESGTDNEKQLVHGSSLFVRDSIRKNHPAIVVLPQYQLLE
jgi:predicted peptidase